MAEPQLKESEKDVLQCLSNANNTWTQNLDMKSILLIAPQFLAPLLGGILSSIWQRFWVFFLSCVSGWAQWELGCLHVLT